ncbi:lamin tail domain-containing protein [Streptomyces melanogenes]|uniref:Lamin tail domain-containing protein n=1 Tax=Streptomyces melanogenes TaxID=67326 RepID=A0ABZ1XE04_9ACTN|nr:lamin tail domain-containing protein [Streptomyces melanogenes]
MSASRTSRRIFATVLAAGTLIGAAALPAAADGHHRHAPRDTVVIGQVQYNSPGRDDHSNRSLNNEWVEVMNTGRHAVNLRGFTLTASDGARYRFHTLRLEGHSAVRVHTGVGRDSSSDVYQDRHTYVWDNHRDTATLRNDNGRILDTAMWGRGHQGGHRHH